MPGKHTRGFASMDREKQRQIASKGGKAAHLKGTAHEFTPAEARTAGRKGGKASQAKRHELAALGTPPRPQAPTPPAETPSSPTSGAAEAMTVTGDIFNLLRTDHQTATQLLKRMIAATDNFDLQEELYPALRRELELHTSAEEETVYPLLEQQPSAREMAEEAELEHTEIRELLSQMDSLYGSEGGTEAQRDTWLATLNDLKDNFEHHVAQEESEIFQTMTKLFSETELKDMAEQFVRTKQSLQKVQERAA